MKTVNIKKMLAALLCVMLLLSALPFSMLGVSAEVTITSLAEAEAYLIENPNPSGEGKEALDSFLKNSYLKFDPSAGANTFTYSPAVFTAYPNVDRYVWTTSSGGQTRANSDLFAATDVRKITAVFNKASAAGAVVNMVSDLKFDGEDTGAGYDDSRFGALLANRDGIILAEGAWWNLSPATTSNAIVAKSQNAYGTDKWYQGHETVDSGKYAVLDYIALELDYQYVDDSANSRSKLLFNMKLWADNGDGVYNENDDVLIDTADRSSNAYNFVVVKYYDSDGDGVRELPRTLQYGIPEATVDKLYSVKLSTAADETAAAAYNFVEAHKTAITAASATAENAQAIIDAYTAYTALDDAVKTVLASYVIDGVPYNVGETLAALNDAAIPLLPTAAQTAFKNYYNTNIEALNAADGKLAEINTALGLYNAVEDSHKGNLSAQYAHICNLLDGYFITDTAVTYDTKALYDTEALTEYTNISDYFKNEIFTFKSGSTNAKMIDSSKFNSKRADNITVAFDYNYTDANSSIGFGLVPEVTLPEGITDNRNTNLGSGLSALTYNTTRLKYPTSDDNANSSYWFYFVDPGKDNGTKSVYKGIGFGGLYSFESASSWELVENSTTKYAVPGDRIVFDMSYTVEETKNKKGLKAARIYFTKFFVYIEDSATTTTLNVYDEGKDIKLYNAVSELFYVFGDETMPLPYFQTRAVSMDKIQYFKATSPATFESKYADLLNGTSTDAARTLEMYAEYQAGATVSEGTPAKVEAAVTNAGLRPTAGGATLSVKADTHIGFYVDKPVATGVESTVGALVSAYNYMVDNHISVLTKGMGDAGVLEATPQSNAYCEANQLMLKVTNLYGAENNWGRWIVVRYYATYTVNETPVVIYSTTPEDDINDNNNPASATGVSHDGVAIRSINGLIKSIANKIENNVEVKGDTVGISYNDKNGVPQNTYTDTKLREAYEANKNSTIYKTALDTLYFLMSYKNALI